VDHWGSHIVNQPSSLRLQAPQAKALFAATEEMGVRDIFADTVSIGRSYDLPFRIRGRYFLQDLQRAHGIVQDLIHLGCEPVGLGITRLDPGQAFPQPGSGGDGCHTFKVLLYEGVDLMLPGRGYGIEAMQYPLLQCVLGRSSRFQADCSHCDQDCRGKQHHQPDANGKPDDLAALLPATFLRAELAPNSSFA
jgi:hypothetical protein